MNQKYFSKIVCFLCCAWILLLISISGCGNGNVTTVGTVRYSDGTILDCGMVIFSNDLHQYTGIVQPNGSFELVSGDGKHGLPAGNYGVSVTATDENDQPLVNSQFGSPSTSGLAFEVKSGQKNHYNITVEKP